MSPCVLCVCVCVCVCVCACVWQMLVRNGNEHYFNPVLQLLKYEWFSQFCSTASIKCCFPLLWKIIPNFYKCFAIIEFFLYFRGQSQLQLTNSFIKKTLFKKRISNMPCQFRTHLRCYNSLQIYLIMTDWVKFAGGCWHFYAYEVFK